MLQSMRSQKPNGRPFAASAKQNSQKLDTQTQPNYLSYRVPRVSEHLKTLTPQQVEAVKPTMDWKDDH